MLLLHELVNHCLTEIGHLLVPIDVFGFTYPRLEQLMITTLNKYQQYIPCHRKEFMTIYDSVIINDAQRVFSIKPYATTWEYSDSMEFKDWDWDYITKILTTNISGDFLVQYLGKYTVESSKSYSSTVSQLFPEETYVSIPLKGHFKKGTLTVTLNEGTIDPVNFTVNVTSDTFTISNTSTMYSKLTTVSIVRFSSGGTLPSPLQTETDYYVIKKDANNLQLSLSYLDINTVAKIFTTNVGTSTTNITVTGHGYVNNQPVQLITTGTLPSPFTTNTTYYVNVINANTIQLKPTTVGSVITFSDNGTGTHKVYSGFVDFTNTGTGTHTITKQQFIMKEVISSYSPNGEYIQLTGTLGNAYVSFLNTEVSIPNQTDTVAMSTLDMLLYDITAKFTDSADLVVSFNSEYKSIKEMSLEDSLYVDLFKGEFMKALGTSKAITRLEGLPFDVSVDELYDKGSELSQKVMEDLQNNRSKWYLFR